MNNPIKLLISGADMGGLIASCALRHDFHESSYCRRLLCQHSREPCGRQGGEILPQVLSLAIVGRDMIAIISSDS